MADAAPPALKPVQCRRCGATLGVLDDGGSVRVSATVIVESRADFRCACCGFVRTWRPAPVDVAARTG